MKAWKIIRKILFALGGVFLILITLIAGTGIYAWTHPKETWELVQKYVLPADLKISWQDLDIRVRHLKGFEFSLDAKVDQLRIDKESPQLHLPVELAQLRILASPFAVKNLLVIQEVNVRATQKMSFVAGPPTDEPEVESPFETLHKYLNLLRKSSKFKIENFDIEMEQFVFTPYEGKPVAVQAKLERSQKTSDDQVDFRLQVELPGNPGGVIAAQGILSLNRLNSDQTFLDSKIQVKGWGVETQQNLSFRSQGVDTLIRSGGVIQYRKDKLKVTLQPDLSAKVGSQEAIIVLKMNASGLPGPYVKIDNLEARLNIPFSEGESWSSEASNFSVSVPLKLFFIDKNMKPPFEKACACKIPEFLKTDLSGKVWFKHLLGKPQAEKPVLESRLKLESLDNKLISMDLAASLSVKKKLQQYFIEPTIDSHVVLHSFRGLRNFLDAKNILVPAPLDILDGTIELKAEGPINRAEEIYKFPLFAKVRLASKLQQVNLDSDSLVNLFRTADAMDVKVKVSVLDLQLELPPLNPVGGMPKVAPDSRILKRPKVIKVKKRDAFKISFEFEMETAKPGAIRLLSQYANPYLPLSLSIRADQTKQTTGYVQTEPFKVEYLRRVVQVEKFRLDIENVQKNILPLSGRLRIDQADYKVYINFEGTVQHPQIVLSSVPELTQNEIISVLLYGRPSDLESSDAQTAGSFEAAMADKAIGIFGLWAFAATPIQSFSYNPLTKVYTATVKITDDLTAGIGTNWEESARLELRKRVSQKWMLTASWTPNEEGDVEEKLVLQWEQRF